jgi:hypothetical protein
MNKRKFIKILSVFVSINMLTQVFYPTVALALTGGPSQPEMQAFEPIGTTNMVDLSSGSFTYNIPLMDVEGYPINISYHSGITMDQEASWVGLGWNINLGEINRQMRGLPDDFQGDTVTQSYNMKDNITVGLDASAQLKLFGLPLKVGSLTVSAGIYYNNYKGPGMEYGISPSLNSGQSNKGTLTGSIGLNFNSQSGLDITPSIGYSKEVAKNKQNEFDAGIKVGTAYNSRSGLKNITMTKDLDVSHKAKPNSTKSTDEGESSVSSTLSFSAPSYTPTIKMSMINTAITLHATIGGALIGAHPDLTFSGYLNDQTLATHSVGLPAFGYMYADAAGDNPYALHDFNREKDMPYQQHMASLPITNFTYDLFSINGQGVSGQFRPFRGDVGVLYDHENYNQSISVSLGAELGVGDLAHYGIDLNFNSSNTVSDKWTTDNDFGSVVDFIGLQAGNINYEPFYIKSIGEKTVNDASYYNTIAGTSAMRVHLDYTGGTVKARNIFDFGNSTLWVNNNLKKTRREKRSQSTSILSASEANCFGLDKTINSYPLDTNVYGNCTYSSKIKHISRLSWPGHHMSEITVTNPDGKRYVYGLPAYNTKQQEATFSINSGLKTSSSNYYLSDSINKVSYSPGSDNSINNTKGLDNYFDQQQLPAYSHSFLLTGILSPDYVDLTNDGITDDDLGEAVKINYTQLYSKAKPFKWRTPFEKDTASYQIGMMSDPTDDKANYIYGEKEIWYAHSIESKTMVAQFILQDRYDGFGVADSNGGIDSCKHLKCIKEIDLYSKADLIKNGTNAVPIKTVHFVYSYLLCPGTPNSNASTHGKLTLTSIYFTYGNNTEGSLNSYKFSYPTSTNMSYSHNHYDRWGYFKDNPSGMPPNEDFSYTLQDTTHTNSFARAWNMNGIDLPSGGHITIKYESNDYGYVQNQRAGQMFIIKGMGRNKTDAPSADLYTQSSGLHFNDWIFVDLPQAVKSKQDFYNKYLAGVDSTNPGGNPVSKLYFRFLVNVGNVTTPTYEYVPGYCDISNYDTVSSTRGAIQISEISSGDPLVGSANPISIASWQFLRLNLPQVAYPGSKVTGSAISIIEFILGIIPEVIDIFTGFDNRAVLQNFGKYIVPSNSYVRLDNPNYRKLGDGARVNEIDISDNWSMMASGQSTSTYGQTFNYTTTLPNGQVVSTGVATDEPTVGGDENQLHQPLAYQEKYLLAPNNNFYTETPLGESLYPAPGVVYGKVTVTNLSNPGVSRTATGYTVNEFYTAKDFPVQNTWTDPMPERIKPNILLSIFSVGVQDFMNVSQGFAVEVNDMAGKEKSQEVYDQKGSLISSVRYYYKVDNPNSQTLHLNNDVQVVNTGGSISTASVGKDIDVWEDMREEDTQTLGIGATFNTDAFVLPFFAMVVPDIFPDYSSEHTRFRSAVTTKYIHRTGLLDHVIKTQNGSQATTQNVLYDGETGEVVLTQTNNEFNKPIYNFTYPAHVAYDGMGSAYQNIGAVVGVTTTSTGVISTASGSPSTYFASGDEVETYGYMTIGGHTIIDTLSSIKGWVAQPTSGSYILMTASGTPIHLATTALVKIIRSGRRNMASIPVGSIVSMNSPINAHDSIQVNQNLQILQASASLFNNGWKIPFNAVETPVCVTTTTRMDTCVAHFLDSIIAHHQLFAKPSDSIHFGKYVRGGGCHADSSELYYALSERIGMDETSTFRAKLGNSILTINSISGSPIYLDSLSSLFMICPESVLPGERLKWDSITSGGCLDMWVYRNCHHECTGEFIRCFDYPLLAATACLSNVSCHDSCENLAVNNTFNPYAQGLLGNWRPERNYVYYDSRTPSPSVTTSDIWKNGVFSHFNQIWDVPTGSSTTWNLDTTDKNWTWTSRITMYDQKGNEIEDKDALGRYSSAIYGYVQSLPVAVSSNAQYKEIAFDGFEDYGFNNTCNSRCDNSHFSFYNYISDTTSTQAHTGKYSLKISPGGNAYVFRYINYYNGAIDSAGSTNYYLKNGGNIPQFSPDSGNYLLSAWVKENVTCGTTGYTKDSIVVNYSGSSAKSIMKPSGPVIEGWQRFEGRFKIPRLATAITVTLYAGSNTAYYDDIRIEPFAAEMKTYVYDPSSLRLVATLDENNYATIYEYNDEGILMRVKKETERGIMTIKESRSSYPR